jgi:uncharacterized alkaline shock family protein YloU
MAERKVEILNEDGCITIWDDVITAIARFATEKVPGATRPLRSGGAGIMGLFGGEDLSPNIKTELGENGVRVELRIVVEYGYPLHEVAQGVQAHVQADVEEMTGIAVTGVDVYVKKVVPPQVARRTEND